MYVSTGTDDPVQRVSWDAATAGWDADGYRLPTEMEWMWAAMGADQDAKPGDRSERNCLGLNSQLLNHSQRRCSRALDAAGFPLRSLPLRWLLLWTIR